jgi:hypothetical protein
MKSLCLLVAIPILTSCASVKTTMNLQDALVRGDQQAVDVLTERFLDSKVRIASRALKDDRPVARAIILHAFVDGNLRQLGIDRVSEYFFCVLELRFRVESRDLVPEITVFEECRNSDACDACSTLMYPLTPRVRNRMREYWQDRPF